MQVEVIKDEARFLALAAPWNGCLAGMPCGNPFLSHRWLSCWWSVFGAGKELLVLVIRDGETILAAAPLMRKRLPYYRVPVEQILFIGTQTFDRLSFLHQSDDPAPLRALWRHLADLCTGRTIIRLEGLPMDAPTVSASRDLPGVWAEETSSTLPYVPIDRSWEEYRKGLTHKFRSEMRTRAKVFAQWGAWRLDVCRGRDVRSHLDSLAAVEGGSAKLESGTSFLTDERHHAFMRDLLEDPGVVEPVLLRLLIDDRLIAYLLGFIHGRVFCAYNTAYLPGYEKGSPGKWIMDQSLNFAFDEGLAEFDFLRGRFGYKERWRPHLRCSRRRLLFPANPLGRLLRAGVFGLRPRLKRSLGRGG
jgi:CelD/BcsL family acetyltransferase involved in cellulose biosynthesis